MEHKEHFHGSDLEKIEKIYGIKKEELVSFSANVNPLGLSELVKKELSNHLDCLTAYPDREYTGLRKAIASYVNCDYQNVLVGNGASELISLLAKVCKPKKALILGPTYSEYEHSIGLTGGKSDYFELMEKDNFVLDKECLLAHLDAGYDLCVLCNPNNPTSALIEKGALEEVLSVAKENNVLMLVDETYMEFVSDVDSVSAIGLTSKYSN
ncbi:MAG: aminotransferase class I/II-fold pyridoxal phosphate-dependent enzyme, partial [Lachnospiraceae bacterium]|nr:aminotransferase class I/II-fold pyridoxal phosphate-dependent enzyme [Lachnospiraceae bacterium]